MKLDYLYSLLCSEDSEHYRKYPDIAKSEDALDDLLQNGMFRNREHNRLPISGSNADMPDWSSQDELADYQRAIMEMET